MGIITMNMMKKWITIRRYNGCSNKNRFKKRGAVNFYGGHTL